MSTLLTSSLKSGNSKLYPFIFIVETTWKVDKFIVLTPFGACSSVLTYDTPIISLSSISTVSRSLLSKVLIICSLLLWVCLKFYNEKIW